MVETSLLLTMLLFAGMVNILLDNFVFFSFFLFKNLLTISGKKPTEDEVKEAQKDYDKALLVAAKGKKRLNFVNTAPAPNASAKGGLTNASAPGLNDAAGGRGVGGAATADVGGRGSGGRGEGYFKCS